jgi:Fe-Mn family superoxide dismutase
MLVQAQYKAKDFNLKGLTGISDKQVEVHLGLYKGYVNNTNLLNERLADLFKQDKVATPEYAELTRRLGFEYDGMILHEYYFGNLKAGGARFDPNGRLGQAMQQSFGGHDNWLKDFRAVGTMRGVGWAVLFQDPVTGYLNNFWLTLHQEGVPAGFKPILVMDVWEHAFMVDYVPAERSKYIDAFFQNVDWSVCEDRLMQQAAVREIGR